VSNELLTEDIYVRLQTPFAFWGHQYLLFNAEFSSANCKPCVSAITDQFTQSLQASVQRVHTYVQGLEQKIGELEKKNK